MVTAIPASTPSKITPYPLDRLFVALLCIGPGDDADATFATATGADAGTAAGTIASTG